MEWEGRETKEAGYQSVASLMAPPRDQICNLSMGPDLKLNLQSFDVSNDTQVNWARASLIILTPPKTFLNTFTWDKIQLHYASKV